MVDLKQMRDVIIRPSLEAIDLYSPEATNLVLFTGLQESRYKYVKQLHNGPALSFWQIEPATIDDIFKNYLGYRNVLSCMVQYLMTKDSAVNQLAGNLPFAVAMCRLVYRRSPLPLPKIGDGPGMAHIWKQAYNTPLGKGTEQEFIDNWEQHRGQLDDY